MARIGKIARGNSGLRRKNFFAVFVAIGKLLVPDAVDAGDARVTQHVIEGTVFEHEHDDVPDARIRPAAPRNFRAFRG